MSATTDEFGIIGLGNIGGNLALQAMQKGVHVVGYDRREPRQDLVDAKIDHAEQVEHPRDRLSALPATARPAV
jgi:6-phosphogluconate dehydrogenase (decarboxylating)